MDVLYFRPGSVPPVKVARWRTVYDVIWLKEGDDYKPYLIVMQRMRNGKVGLRLLPLSYSQEVAEYVRQQIKNCWAAKLRGEEFRWFVKTYGMHPTAWCIKQIMYGKRFKSEEKKKKWSDLVLEALVNKYREMFGKNL
ncbi:hypothetical protein [Thermofilum sp.]|uniref:hypothetical protein n=1 Tax=Thermofilum sp. TaxID=1961369 RepID=UPI00317FAA76